MRLLQRFLWQLAAKGLHDRVALGVGLRLWSVTGTGGAGKSSLTDELLRRYLLAHPDRKVAVLAFDPAKRKSGGALLGDRIRMNDHANDPDVFIRSLATRGHLGGLSRSTNDVVAVLDAMGYDVVLIETVGIGQSEVTVASMVDFFLVLLQPGR